ncbi:ribosome maturation factor RimM [Halarcobacter anaerophilus]|uniref:Ribosome maturation factor RimM n=1 Tax=Halarcobacter anaerophilus TaxID=877500 RepID=A0A4Q0Y3K7_9BACT|nr:ribosome maturation factor RimM [Halarcobacter anaerophilus]QDF29869.1 16S rRNA processing protein [Halarcobacter anaerophilus]RXJ62831.1 16S rRNA processing protein RimM [Halarcobacter anaerophilus]
MNKKIYVAKLGKAVGLKGHLRLFIDSDFPEQFKKGATFTTNRDETLIVQEYNFSKELIKFENYDDIDIAKKLTNQELYVSEDQTKENCKLEDKEYFWFDIIGCEIFEDEKCLGVVKDIHRYPLDDYLEVSTNSDLIKSLNLPKSFLIPYIREEFILEVDIDNKVIKTQKCFEILENS